MPAALDHHERGLDARLLQRRGQRLALRQRHQGVPVAVHDEEGRGILADVRQGAGRPGLLLVVLDRAADELGHHGTRLIGQTAHGQHFGRAEEIDDALDAAGLVEVAALVKLLNAAGGAQHGDQVPAGRFAPDADVVGIEVILGGVGPQPADGRLAIFDLGREEGVLAEAVVDGGHGVPLGDQGHGRAVFFAARLPSPAVNPDDQRQPARGLLGQIDVQAISLVAVGHVGEVPQDLDALRLCGRRADPRQRHRHCKHTEPCPLHFLSPWPPARPLGFSLSSQVQVYARYKQSSTSAGAFRLETNPSRNSQESRSLNGRQKESPPAAKVPPFLAATGDR